MTTPLQKKINNLVVFFFVSMTGNMAFAQEAGLTISTIDPISYASHISPIKLTKIDVFKTSPGEFLPIGLLVNSNTSITDFTVSPLSIRSKTGIEINAQSLDIRIAKKWFQSSVKKINPEKEKFLTYELLLHDESLIKIDLNKKINYLKTKVGNKETYKDISASNAKISALEMFNDNLELQPTTIAQNNELFYWITLHVPSNVAPGNYEIELGLFSKSNAIRTTKINIEILPFLLDKSTLDYGLYYRARLTNESRITPNSEYKTPQQYRLELDNMKKHGVLYPTLYEKINTGRVTEALQIRDQIGFPKDKIFTLGIITNKVKDERVLNNFASQVSEWKNLSLSFGYNDIYIYTLDEAHNVDLHNQFPSWNRSKATGVKLFGALRPDSFNIASEKVDQPILPGRSVSAEEVNNWRNKGKPAYMYSNPQVGIEDAELYRRNYGFMLWLSGYAGSINYAYQHAFNDIWNDFDDTRYRDHVFAYPTKDGLIDTVQWEGFREAINDTRYIDFLAKRIGIKSARDRLSSWLATSKNMNQVRENVINEILKVK